MSEPNHTPSCPPTDDNITVGSSRLSDFFDKPSGIDPDLTVGEWLDQGYDDDNPDFIAYNTMSLEEFDLYCRGTMSLEEFNFYRKDSQ
jgi:hypothetical protein